MLNSSRSRSSIMQCRKWTSYSTCMASALAVCVLFSGLALDQEAVGAKSGQSAITPQDSRQASGLKLRVDTTLVLIPVAVTDSLNRFVLGLQKEDFHLFE